MTPGAGTAQTARRIPRGAQRYGSAQLPPQHVGAPFMTPGAGTAQAVYRIPPGAQRYGDAQLLPPHVVAPFMTPGAGTAQAVRRIPPGAQRLWRCAVAATARRGAIHDARCRDGTSSPPHSARYGLADGGGVG